jgi:hypothetical protein
MINRIMITSLALTVIAYLLSVNHFDTGLSMEGVIFVYAISFFFCLILTHLNRNIHAMQSLPTYKEYIKGHPECKADNGTLCRECGSNRIEYEGARGRYANKLTFICKSCGAQLYHREP